MSVYLPRNTRRAGFVRPFQTSLPGGTEGSNPPPSSGESIANLTSSTKAVMFFRGGLTSVETGEYVVRQAYKR